MGRAAADAAALDDLRWHYGEAYLIELIGDRWIAQRRDSHATMSAKGPDQLLDLIRADYAAHPVPRDPRPCRFRAETAGGSAHG